MNFVEYPDRDLMMIDLANKIAGELNSHVQRHEAATLAVPGGTTPGPAFDALSAATLDWSSVRILLTDERWVPVEDARSNTRLLRQRLLVDRAAAATYVPLYADTPEPEDALEHLTAQVQGVLPLTVLLLGMGDDMHVASLFPFAEGLEAALADDAPPLLPVRSADVPEARITLTAPVMKQAMSTHILITGPKKREALERARREGDPVKAPVISVLGEATVHWAE
ncbi:6-phosphogluconolactonase [Psychromarinibacter sp. C21-152]|uniref:6-phosphogluconolactonase n=1 Tax=Psychromarinibacter sediminicola TaxID=3033385 RepID=A0AAE3NRZ8_9RHOB|nr:6-phosphogluconolactonase [Psychromarinibacter sediminicola]MDF0599462.1 6-phosphogluconolactonase [Psychromarinibacter sediminicola]